MRVQRYVLVLLTVLASLGLRAQTDSLRVSLLTCAPGTEVYQLYGHTALRVQDVSRGMDVVFNYGVFDFKAPNFMWRFILGQCDYMVAAYPFQGFLQDYEKRGSQVTEQVLALTNEEKARLVSNLATNSLPQNRTYRYNFLLNNCTTKARDMIEQAVDGHVVYPKQTENPTYRTMLHRYSHDYPWDETGCDLLLGAACDTVLSDRACQFLPEYLMQCMDGAQIYDDDDNRRPLVGETNIILPDMPEKRIEPAATTWQGRLLEWMTPTRAALCLLVICLLVMAAEWYWGRMWWGVDMALMTVQGIMGILVCFMLLFSQHPTVDSNWQAWVLNPLPLLCMPWVVRSARRKKTCPYHYFNLLWLALFVLFMAWIPQTFCAPMLPLALVLLTRPISYYLNYHR